MYLTWYCTGKLPKPKGSFKCNAVGKLSRKKCYGGVRFNVISVMTGSVVVNFSSHSRFQNSHPALAALYSTGYNVEGCTNKRAKFCNNYRGNQSRYLQVSSLKVPFCGIFLLNHFSQTRNIME